MDTQTTNLYDAALQTSAFYLIPQPGYLQIGGADRLAFLQRQTTNDVTLLKPERTLLSALSSATGRILDVFYLLAEPETIGAVTLPGRPALTARFLKSRVFFMDKVTVTDLSAGFAQIDLLGPCASQVLAHIGAGSIPTTGEMVSLSLGGAVLRILGPDRAFRLGFRLLAPVEIAEKLQARLLRLKAARLDLATHDLLRIEAGFPDGLHELTEEYTPLETGLGLAIADDKGCYTGQEVLARQITYDKVTQHMSGLRLESAVSTGERVWVDGKAVGVVTSSCVSPRFGPIALAMIKRPYNQPETSLTVGEQGMAAQVTALPFMAS
jgi:folate-binding protein YgfZ